MTDERLLSLAELAEEQWGLLTSAQAARILGVNALQLKRYTDRGLLVRLRHGVYRLSGSPISPLEALRAEWLALEPPRTATERLKDPIPHGVISHRSAAVLQNLGDLEADVHQFTVPRRRHTRSPDVTFRVAELDREDWHRVGGLPVTRPLRTAVDLAAAHTDGGHLASVVRDVLLTGDTDSARLADALRPYSHYYGIRAGDGGSLVKSFIHRAGVPASAVNVALPNLVEAVRSLSPAADPSAFFRDIDISAVAGTEARDAVRFPEWAPALAQLHKALLPDLAPILKNLHADALGQGTTQPSPDDVVGTAADTRHEKNPEGHAPTEHP
ncbi:type IV toxin-antitoxin system AbiEi family antitoxin domain-containing protein [Nocardia sp. X0981]